MKSNITYSFSLCYVALQYVLVASLPVLYLIYGSNTVLKNGTLFHPPKLQDVMDIFLVSPD